MSKTVVWTLVVMAIIWWILFGWEVTAVMVVAYLLGIAVGIGLV